MTKDINTRFNFNNQPIKSKPSVNPDAGKQQGQDQDAETPAKAAAVSPKFGQYGIGDFLGSASAAGQLQVQQTRIASMMAGFDPSGALLAETNNLPSGLANNTAFALHFSGKYVDTVLGSPDTSGAPS